MVRRNQSAANGAGRPPAVPDSPTLAAEAGRAASPRRVIALGASAGGLEALEAFFQLMPVDSGCAFVVIQHLSPDFKSQMPDLLGRKTRMGIQVAQRRHGGRRRSDLPGAAAHDDGHRVRPSDAAGGRSEGDAAPPDQRLLPRARGGPGRTGHRDRFVRHRHRRHRRHRQCPRARRRGARPGPWHGAVRRHAQGGRGDRRGRPRPGAGGDAPGHHEPARRPAGRRARQAPRGRRDRVRGDR